MWYTNKIIKYTILISHSEQIKTKTKTKQKCLEKIKQISLIELIIQLE